MTAPGHIWRFSFDVPAVDGIHAAANAFLRTSEHGVWVLDDKAASDAYTLHYQRGQWKPPPNKLNYFLNGHVGSSYEDFVASAGWDGWKNAPMHLTVAFRPTPAQDLVKILVEYQLGGPDPNLLYEASEKLLCECVVYETESFARYLRENLALKALPEITTH